MEWKWVQRISSKNAKDKDLMQKMINLLLQRGFKPYKLRENGGQELHVAKCLKWPRDVVWKKL